MTDHELGNQILHKLGVLEGQLQILLKNNEQSDKHFHEIEASLDEVDDRLNSLESTRKMIIWGGAGLAAAVPVIVKLMEKPWLTALLKNF